MAATMSRAAAANLARRGMVYIVWQTAQWDAMVAKIIAAAPTMAAKNVKAIAELYFWDITHDTPVLSGEAEAGWMRGFRAIGKPAPPGRGTPQGHSAGLKQSRTRSRFTGPAPFTQVTNLVPYLRLLEFGYSDKAPAGFLRINTAKHMAQLQRYWFDFVPRCAGKRAGTYRAAVPSTTGLALAGTP